MKWRMLCWNRSEEVKSQARCEETESWMETREERAVVVSSCILLAFFECGFLAGSAVEMHDDFS